MDIYAPLHVDAEIERAVRAGFWKEVGRQLQRCALLIYRDPPLGRSRSRLNWLAGLSFWRNRGWPSAHSTMCACSGHYPERDALPNDHFVPDDPFNLAMTGYDYDAVYVYMELEDRFETTYSNDEMRASMLRNGPSESL